MANLNVAGMVLCGGQSLRMGTAKAWLPFGAETLLQRVVRLLRQVVGPMVVVAAADQELPPLPAHVLLARDAEPGKGPLQGLAAGLAMIEDKAQAVYVTGCDAPFLRPALVTRLIDLLGDSDICMPRIAGRWQPLAAVYRVKVLGAVNRLLAENRRSLMLLGDEVPTRIVTVAELGDVDPDLETFRNVNTPEEYEAALSNIRVGRASWPVPV